jgi:hypothetical protein
MMMFAVTLYGMKPFFNHGICFKLQEVFGGLLKIYLHAFSAFIDCIFIGVIA